MEMPPAAGSYEARRAALAALLDGRRDGDPVPRVAYLPSEDALWQLVAGELTDAHHELAAAAFLNGAERLALPADHVPQLADVSDRLGALTGFRFEPVPGLVPIER